MFSRISKLLIVCIVSIVVCAVHQVEAGTWTQKADMPTARGIAGSAVVDGKIYVVGGAPVPYGISAVVEEYDPATDTWTTRADMPTKRQGVVAAAVDGIVYAIGGWNPGDVSSTVEAYDPATDTWITKSGMPTARNTPAIAVVDGIIYVIGGYSFHPHRTVLSAVEAYDPATDRWTKKADMPTARFLLAACVIDGRIYVSGGEPNFFSEGTCLPTMEVYDPATDTWTQASDMPRAWYAHSASAVGGKMYIIGGADGESLKLWKAGKIEEDEMVESFKVVYVYDPGTDMWTTAADRLPTPRVHLTAAVVDGKIYTIGGGRGDPYELVSTVEEYAPGLPGALSSVSPAGKLLETWGQVRKVQ